MNLIESIEQFVEDKDILVEEFDVESVSSAIKSISDVIGYVAAIMKNLADKNNSGSAAFTKTSLRQIDKNIDLIRKSLPHVFNPEITFGPSTKKALQEISDVLNRQVVRITSESKGLISLIKSDNKDDIEDNTADNTENKEDNFVDDFETEE
jgi:hypothetical protein